ncbi:uncharacterized protein LOC141714744 [Apium graveolens]|uniref:uncharacterized protein LOC141714744 n=1 Tax=Apium graveolens TaxID=4045 RepID=UPI003D792068
MTAQSERSGNNNSNNNNNNNNNNGGASDQLAQTLAALVGNQQPRQPNIVSEFKRLNPPSFDGATDPAIVEKWVQEMEKAFELLGSNDEQKVTVAVYQLQGSAFDWWLMEKRKNEANAEANQKPYLWERFKKALEDKYFLRTTRLQKERDFIRLEQGGKSVTEYEAEFAKLAKYAPTLVADEASRARMLEEGFRSNIRLGVAPFELQTYEAVLNKALVIERGLVESEMATDNWNKKRFAPTRGQTSQGEPLKKPYAYDQMGNQGNQYKCTRCGGNHADRECRWNLGACFHCGEVGHKISQCPKNPPPRKGADTKKGYGRVFQLTGNHN